MDYPLDLRSTFGGSYYKKRIIVTGHTGFKGSWLVTWLEKLGADVIGISLNPNSDPNHWDLLSKTTTTKSHICDIRNKQGMNDLFQSIDPHVIFHLAAQPIVLDSYTTPVETMETNIMGTINILEAGRMCTNLQAICVITTDKCYLNQHTSVPYKEDAHLGGRDPYSASKACAELVTMSYRSSFYTSAPLIATCRGGNVIGGGDWGSRRLIPDIVKATARNEAVEIRHPNAVRPWQHVLDCLSGYLVIGQKLLEKHPLSSHSWNIGPSNNEAASVQEVLNIMTTQWPEIKIKLDPKIHAHEETLLTLDIEKISTAYGWQPLWDVQRSVQETISWYKAYYLEKELMTPDQLIKYNNEARDKGLIWASS